jgi:hypothetical protein
MNDPKFDVIIWGVDYDEGVLSSYRGLTVKADDDIEVRFESGDLSRDLDDIEAWMSERISLNRFCLQVQ